MKRKLTARKYALSPGPAFPLAAVYEAYGGPQNARWQPLQADDRVLQAACRE